MSNTPLNTPFKLFKVKFGFQTRDQYRFAIVEAFSFDDAARRVRQWDRTRKIESIETIDGEYVVLSVSEQERDSVEFEARQVGL